MFNAIVYDKSYVVAADFNGTPFNFKGGRLVLGGFGTFGGGTLKLQFTTDADITWVDLPAQSGAGTSAMTAAGLALVYLPPIRLRVALAGSTAPTLQYFAGDCGGQ